MTPENAKTSQPTQSPLIRLAKGTEKLGWCLLIVAGGSWLLLVLCYRFQFDTCSALTVFPVWCWAMLGLMFAACGFRYCGRRAAILNVLLWLAFLAVFAEEPFSLGRGLIPFQTQIWHRTLQSGNAVRVISLNCGDGGAKSVLEVIPFNPDIVLLQESPGREQLNQLAQDNFPEGWVALFGGDTSTLVRGQIVSIEPANPMRRNSIRARVKLASGLELEILNLRLEPGLVRLDLWSPDCWRKQSENRSLRRDQLLGIVNDLQHAPPDLPVIFGGDFNAPAGDAVYQVLPHSLRDTFPEAGRGWCNTIVNPFPVHRIDQIWVSRHFQAVSLVASQTLNSDHRMVICDLIVR